MFSKTFSCFILFTTIFGTLAQGSNIYHIPPQPPATGDAVSFEATISIDVQVIEANLFYRMNGQQSYKEIELKFLGNTWTATISKVPEGDEIEYFFLFDLQDGSSMVLPDENPNQNPFILSVTPMSTLKSNFNKTKAINISQKEYNFLVINPQENDIVYSDAVLFMVSLYNIPEIDVSSIHLYLDDKDVTTDALVTPDIVTFIPEKVDPGVKIFTIKASTNNGYTIPPFHYTIPVISTKKSRSKFRYSVKGKSAASLDQIAMEQGGDERLNIYQNDLFLKAGWPWLQFKSRIKITSEESPYKQPKNKYLATLESGKFFKISVGDFMPSLSPYTINGKQIRGIGTELKLGWIQFQSAQGELERAIQGIDNTDRSYEVLSVYRDTTKTIYELDRRGYTFRNDLSSYRLALNIRDKIIFGSTFMTTKSDIKSIEKELTNANFSVSVDTSLETESQLDAGIYTFGKFQELVNDQFGYQLLDSGWGGNKPQQNLVAGTDFKFKLDENKFQLEGYWAISFLNKNIWDGTMTLAEMDTLMGDSLDGQILGMTDTLSIPNPTEFEDLMTINMNLVPIIPIDINAFGDSASVDLIDAIMNMPSTAYNLKFQSLYFNNTFVVQYSQVGPEFTSLANPYFQKNNREFSISDKIWLFDRRLQPSINYKLKTNNILKTTTNPYNEKTYGINLNVMPGRGFPSAMYGYKSIIRTNPATDIDTLFNTDSTEYSLQDLRVDFNTQNHLYTINIPINRKNVLYSFGGTYNTIIGKDQLEKERPDILSESIDKSSAAWDTTYSLSNSIIAIDSSSFAWDTTYTRFLSQASNMQLISFVFGARYQNGLRLTFYISNFTNDLIAIGKTELNSASINGSYPVLKEKINFSGTFSYLSSSGLSEFSNYGLSLGSKIKISKAIRLNLSASTKIRSTSDETKLSNLAVKLSTSYIF